MPLRADSTLTAPRSSSKGDTERVELAIAPSEAWHKPVFIAFLLIWMVNVVIVGLGIVLPADGLWLEGLLPVAAVATTLVGLRRVLPWQNVLSMALIIGGFGQLVTMVCVRTGLPFGPLVYLDADSNPLFETVPWWVCCVWIVLVLNARGVARLVLYRWRASRNYGLWVIAASCQLVVLIVLGLEPVATHNKHYWVWNLGRSAVEWSWYGTPISNFLSWGLCAFGLLVATVVWAINKRPAPVAPHFHPAAVWALISIWICVGNAVSHRWLPVIFLMTQFLVIAVLARNSTPHRAPLVNREWAGG